MAIGLAFSLSSPPSFYLDLDITQTHVWDICRSVPQPSLAGVVFNYCVKILSNSKRQVCFDLPEANGKVGT